MKKMDTPKEEKVSSTSTEQKSKKCGHAPVFTYIAILFSAAFLLLLLSYLMQQRTNEQLSGMQETVNSIQSIDELYDSNQELQAKLDDAEGQIETLTQQLTELQTQLTAKEQELATTTTALQQAQAATAADGTQAVTESETP